MTDEERRRTMEFILEQQAQFAANIQRHEEDLKGFQEERKRERKQRAELRESFKTLIELCRIHDIRLDDVQFRSITFEESVRRLDVLVKKNQARLDELERNKPR